MVVQHSFSCLSDAWSLHVTLFSRELFGSLHLSGLVHGASWGSTEPFTLEGLEVTACCTPLSLSPSGSVLLALPGGEGLRPVWVPQGPPLWSQLRGYWLPPVSWWSQPGSAHSFRNSCSTKLPSSDPFSLHLEMFGSSLPCGPWPAD